MVEKVKGRWKSIGGRVIAAERIMISFLSVNRKREINRLESNNRGEY